MTGANGGVGTALVELLALRGVRVIASASRNKHALLRSLGAEPIAAREGPLDEQVRAIVPDGVDLAYDAIGGRGIDECVRATKKGGHVVGYGFMGTMAATASRRTGSTRAHCSSPLYARRSSARSKGPFLRHHRALPKEPRTLPRRPAEARALGRRRESSRPKIAERLPLLEAREGQRAHRTRRRRRQDRAPRLALNSAYPSGRWRGSTATRRHFLSTSTISRSCAHRCVRRSASSSSHNEPSTTRWGDRARRLEPPHGVRAGRVGAEELAHAAGERGPEHEEISLELLDDDESA